MKKYITALVLCVLVMPAFAAGRSTVSNTQTASRGVVAPVNFKSSLKFTNTDAATTGDEERVGVIDDNPQPAVDREKEKLACISNNIGVGNTFVWASRNSNTSNYASMVEDTQNPDNNVCWVRVELKSNNPSIAVSDFGWRYFEMGNRITCGSWADEAKLEKRILDAKKSTRTWATVAGVVGGAGIGVGAMELFGNKLIGGKVMGQKNEDLSETQVLISQLKVLKDGNEQEKADYKTFVTNLQTIQSVCEGGYSGADCSKYDYKAILSAPELK